MILSFIITFAAGLIGYKNSKTRYLALVLVFLTVFFSSVFFILKPAPPNNMQIFYPLRWSWGEWESVHGSNNRWVSLLLLDHEIWRDLCHDGAPIFAGRQGYVSPIYHVFGLNLLAGLTGFAAGLGFKHLVKPLTVRVK